MTPIPSTLISSGSKKEEPRCVCLNEAKASHSHKICAEVSSSVPHFLLVGLSLSPIRCLLRVLCPVSRPITALRGVLPRVVCLSMIAKPRKWKPWPEDGPKPQRKENKIEFNLNVRLQRMETRYENWLVYYYNIAYYYNNDYLYWTQRIAPYKRRPIKKNWLFYFQASKTYKKQTAAQSGRSALSAAIMIHLAVEIVFLHEERMKPLSRCHARNRFIYPQRVAFITHHWDMYGRLCNIKRKDCEWCVGKDVAKRRLWRYVR